MDALESLDDIEIITSKNPLYRIENSYPLLYFE